MFSQRSEYGSTEDVGDIRGRIYAFLEKEDVLTSDASKISSVMEGGHVSSIDTVENGLTKGFGNEEEYRSRRRKLLWYNTTAMLSLAILVSVVLLVSMTVPDESLPGYSSVATTLKSITKKKSTSKSKSRSSSTLSTKPNIIFILTDDQGMGDMDVDGGDFENLMPNIRRLNEAGLNISHYYSASLCTPARSSLLTGKYTVNIGMQHGVVMATQPWGLPLSEKLLPSYFAEIGYASHMVGKWHLGHYSKSHLPTARGFDDFFGYYGGYQHPESYFYEWPGCRNDTGCLPDMHIGSKAYAPDGLFNTYTFAQEAERIIYQHASDGQPFFLYLPIPLIHMPVHPDPEIMSNRSADLAGIPNMWRRRMGAMAIMLDDFVAGIESNLIDSGIMDNSILIFASDNGGQAEGSQMGAGSNFPLRGSKGSLYEGACRVPAFVYSPLLGHSMGSKGRTFNSLFHVTDWLPTLIAGALGEEDLVKDMNLDGVNQWDWMQAQESTEQVPRNQILYNVDTITGISAIRVGNWKLLLNESEDVGWYDGDSFGLDLCQNGATQSIQLFDLDSDEEERYDLSEQQPDIVSSLRSIIDGYISKAVTPAYCSVFDDDAIEKWFEKDEVVPWIKLNSSTEDYACPTITYTSGWCTMVSADTPMPGPPVNAMGSGTIKLGNKVLPGDQNFETIKKVVDNR